MRKLSSGVRAPLTSADTNASNSNSSNDETGNDNKESRKMLVDATSTPLSHITSSSSNPNTKLVGSHASNNSNTISNMNNGSSSKAPHGNDKSSLEYTTKTSIHASNMPVSFWKLFLDNWVYVSTYCMVFGSFGVCVGFLGPTVFDLGCQTHSDLRKMNWVFFVQLIMTLVGSISAGCLADKVPIHSLMLTGAIGVSLSMFVIPACGNLSTLIVVLVVMGWCMGCLDCLANLQVIQMFGRNVGPFLQALHCSYGVGAFVSPMIASAFLLNKDCTPYITGFTVETPTYLSQNGSSHMEASTVTVRIPPQPQQVFRYRHMSKLPNAFYILGGLQLFIATLVGLLIVQESRGALRPRNICFDDHDPLHGIEPKKSFSMSRLSGWVRATCCACGPTQVMIVTFFACMSLFVFDGLQSSFANYIYTYAHESGVTGLRKYEGAILDACFWGLFAAGRLIAVPLASKFTAAFMLLVNISGCICSLLITIIFSWSHAVIYIGTCGVGLFVSSMSPTVMSMAEQYIDINPSITTCLVVVAALGEAMCPVIVGYLVVNIGPGTFLFFCLAFSVAALVLYIFLSLSGKQTEKYAASEQGSFFWLSSKEICLEGESSLIKPGTVKYYSRMQDSDSTMEMGELGNAHKDHELQNGSHQ